MPKILVLQMNRGGGEPTTFHPSEPVGEHPPRTDPNDWLYLGLGFKSSYHYNDEMIHGFIARVCKDDASEPGLSVFVLSSDCEASC